MAWLPFIPVVIWCGAVFVLGLAVGSFLNVLIARLPFEKSIIWPSSRCFACFTPIGPLDNIPILGYLRLRGKCRQCGATFSSRYLWVELGTGLAHPRPLCGGGAGQHLQHPGSQLQYPGRLHRAAPVARSPALFLYHAVLLWALIAAAAIDAEHRIIPPLIPYTAMVVGIVGGALMPWPWPHPATAASAIPARRPVDAPRVLGQDRHWAFSPGRSGSQRSEFAPPGSLQLGLLNGLIGALAGSLVVRTVRWLFEPASAARRSAWATPTC